MPPAEVRQQVMLGPINRSLGPCGARRLTTPLALSHLTASCPPLKTTARASMCAVLLRMLRNSGGLQH